MWKLVKLGSCSALDACVCPQSSHLSPPAMKNGMRPYPVTFALLSHIGKDGCISSMRKSCRQRWEMTSPPYASFPGHCSAPQLPLASGSIHLLGDRKHFSGSHVYFSVGISGYIRVSMHSILPCVLFDALVISGFVHNGIFGCFFFFFLNDLNILRGDDTKKKYRTETFTVAQN